MAFFLLGGCLLLGLLGTGVPFADFFGMKGANSSMPYMLSKTLIVTVLCFFGGLVVLNLFGICVKDVIKPRTLGFATLAMCLSIAYVWLNLVLLRRYGPARVTPIAVTTVALGTFFASAAINKQPVGCIDIAATIGIGGLLFLLWRNQKVLTN